MSTVQELPAVEHPTNRPNFYIMHFMGWRFAFSYQTVVGFIPPGGGIWRVIQNYWGPTTGKHLNWLDGGDKKSRLSSEEFNKALEGARTSAALITH